MAIHLLHTREVHVHAFHLDPPNRALGGSRKNVRVPVYRALWLISGKDYRGRLGAKDQARRAKAVA